MSSGLGAKWVLGMTWILLAGAMQGGFPLPMKFARKWKWEHIWLASSVFGLVLFPWWIAVKTIPHVGQAFQSIPATSLLVVCLFGTGWGIGGLLFGQGVYRVGLSLATGIVLGLTSAIGSVVPMVLFHPAKLFERTGLILIASVMNAVGGMALCTSAGALRERQLDEAQSGTRGKIFRRGSYWTGIVICVLSGLLSPLFNFALICGEDVVSSATTHGARIVDAPNLIWAIAMSGGLLPTIVYCTYLLTRGSTWRLFASRSVLPDGLLAVLMGVLFAYGNSFYGAGVEYLGAIGPILGWPVFMAMQVITGNFLGVATGEWQGVSRSAMYRLVAGIAALVIAIFMVGGLET